MLLEPPKLRELLVKPGHVPAEDFDAALNEAKAEGIELEELLINKSLIKDDQLGKLIADEIGFPFVDLKNTKIDGVTMDIIPQLVAESKGIVPYEITKNALKVGMLDPTNSEMKHFIEKKAGTKIIPYLITRSGLENALTLYSAGLKTEIKSILDKLKDPTLSREESDEATVEIVDKILDYGYENKASDIHIEPYEEKILVRFRMDGVLNDVLDVPNELAELILTRIKIVSKMRTDEHRAAQDGKFRYKPKVKGGESSIDVRVSIIPVTKGENVVMRLLSAESRKFSLQDIGLGTSDAAKLQKAIKNPHGMILVTGPTGSGKTTTLYSVLKLLNDREVHISTIEDPVEYDIEGVSQIQVDTKTNLTFAKGLRAVVRQDPDIIMVGEIRDDETAGIAVNSAMTGHLVLSTLHTNDAATTLPRLADMKIEPFLVASTVNIVIAQRLVRKICEHCRASFGISEDEKKLIESNPKIMEIFKKKGYKNLKSATFFHGAGCQVCNDTGYQGRVGVFEVLEMTPEIKKLVQDKASSNQIVAEALKNGMTTMLEDGIAKVLLGVTTLDEVLRVAYKSE
jgi:type IV pilus assembly protein PilB